MPHDRLPILMYHSIDGSGSVVSVTPAQLESHLNSIRSAGLRTLTLLDAIQHRARRSQWPERSIVITFDDAYASVFELAAPLLIARGMTATVFLIAGRMGADNTWAPPPPRLGVRPIMTWAHAAELAKNGFELGAHTLTHPNLAHLEPDHQHAEITRSAQIIRDQLGALTPTVGRTFAYPYGSAPAPARAAATSLFDAAVTTRLALSPHTEHHAALSRIDTFYLRSPGRMDALLAGRLHAELAARRIARHARQLLTQGPRPRTPAALNQGAPA